MRYVLFLVALIFSCSKPTQESSLHNDSTTIHNPGTHAVAPPYLEVDTVNILSERKLRLTAKYNYENYGSKSYKLDTPRMIVVHYTANDNLASTLNTFKADYIITAIDSTHRVRSLNVGIHYVIDKDGKIFSLMPDTILARHIIGFNHVSLGIENVARDSTVLSIAQVESNARLIRFLTNKYHTIEYLIGHHEYAIDTLQHFKLFRELNPNYEFSGKIDPGNAFMSKLRSKLASDGVVLKR